MTIDPFDSLRFHFHLKQFHNADEEKRFMARLGGFSLHSTQSLPCSCLVVVNWLDAVYSGLYRPDLENYW